MLDLRYDAMPKEVKAALTPMVKEFLYLIPTWCHQLTIHYKGDANDEGHSADCDASWEYHYAHLTFYPAWLDEDEPNRRAMVLHEVLHIIQAPAISFVDELLTTISDTQTKQILEKQWNKAQEFVNEDFANVLGAQKKR